MPGPLSLIILLAASEAGSPSAEAMAVAVRDGLGDARIEVRLTRNSPTDADVLATEAQSRPTAVAELVWMEPDHRKVTLRVHLVQTQRWLERSIIYAVSDPMDERGRTLGLAIATALPEIAATSLPSDSPPPSEAIPPIPPPPAPTMPVVIAPARPSPEVGTRTPPSETTRTILPEAADVPFGRPGSRRSSVETALFASGATGVGGSANSVGFGGAVEWSPATAFALRMSASERSGTVNAAEANVFTFIAATGISFHPRRATRAWPIDVSLRADYLLVRQSTTHFDSDDPRPVADARWLSGVDAFGDVGWLLSSDVTALVGVGVEDVMAPTYVNVRGMRVATIPPLRALAEAGIRVSF